MKRFGIVSYNIYGNFTNYGSALQTYALHHAIDRLSPDEWQSVVIDYCPDVLRDKDVLNPMRHMWDKDLEARRQCELSLPAIRINYEKFKRFYHEQYRLSSQAYTSENFNDTATAEQLDGYVCGSDTVFCIDEFGFDDGYYAQYPVMRNRGSVAYAASFGDSHFDSDSYRTLDERLANFKAIGLREQEMVPYVQQHTEGIPVSRVIDPTLLLEPADYAPIVAAPQSQEKYLLLYARRYNPKMQAFAEKMAAENGWKVIEISLRATHAERHRMFYEAGVEEFLSLVQHAEYVVTNSFHGMIFAVQFSRPFYIFSREQCDTKITELLALFGLSDRIRVTGDEAPAQAPDYAAVHRRIATARQASLQFLKQELALL